MNDIVKGSKNGFNCYKVRDPENFLQIKPYAAELEKSREEDMKSVMKSINEVRSDLESLKTEVSNTTKMENVDHLRKMMFNVEGKITHLKGALREELLKLMKNEESLSRDVEFMQRRMEDWAKPLDGQIFKPVKQSSYKVKKTNSNNPVDQFQKFLSQSGGHYGGWEEQDHLLFLKERKKYKNKEKFFSAFHYLLPDLSYEKIEEHEEWYKKYESLRDSQKEAIQKWRRDKESQKNKGKENEEVGEEKTEVKKSAHQRINIAERIKEWKNQQQLKKLEEEERQKKEKEKLKQEEKKKQELQAMKKLAVAQYKAEKLNKLKETLPGDDHRPPPQETKIKNKIMMKAFRVQDLKYIEKKKVIRLQIESAASSEKLRLTKPALEYFLRRDPQRIFQPTLIWSQHCLETQKREKINPVFDLNSIPRLAIPEWRRVLT